MKIINNHPCYLHVPKNPNYSHKMVRILRAVQLFSGHTKKDIQTLAAFSIHKSTYMGGVYYPGYAFTELCRNGFISKFQFKNLMTMRPTYLYEITYKGKTFLKKADENDLKWIEDIHGRH